MGEAMDWLKAVESEKVASRASRRAGVQLRLNHPEEFLDLFNQYWNEEYSNSQILQEVDHDRTSNP